MKELPQRSLEGEKESQRDTTKFVVSTNLLQVQKVGIW